MHHSTAAAARSFPPARHETKHAHHLCNLTMSGLQGDDDQSKEEKLKAALWYAMGQTIDSIALAQNLNATPHFIGGLSELVWGQIENVAQDLEAFSKHSNRSTINTKDVLLLSRRNEALADILRNQAAEASKEAATTGR